MSEQIYSLTYVSQANVLMTLHGMTSEIGIKSRNNPSEAAITGVLFFDGRNIAQVLEAPLQQLEAVWDEISSDLRHVRLRILEFCAKDGRSFDSARIVTSLEEPTDDLGTLASDHDRQQHHALVHALTKAVAALHADSAAD